MKKEVLYAVVTLCREVDEERSMFIKRWGSRDTLKASKLLNLMGLKTPGTLDMLSEAFGCNSRACLQRAFTRALYGCIKYLDKIYTLEELCYEAERILGE